MKDFISPETRSALQKDPYSWFEIIIIILLIGILYILLQG